MLELKISCENADEARMYLNAPQYHSLIYDLYNALRRATKHGTEADILEQVRNFLPDLSNAADNQTGPY